jgi:hypothetical protein
MKRLLILAAALFAVPALADTLYVTEYVGAPPNSVYYQAVNAPAVVSSIVTITGTSAQSAAFSSTTGIVRLHCDVACVVEVGGTNPTAVTASAKLAAGQTEYFVVKPGHKVAVKTP